MSKTNESDFNNFEKKLDVLIKRFEEQKGIIDSYVKRERDWKKDKVLHRKEVAHLEKNLEKAKNE
ncbi:MAG: hypothetical protein CBD86_03560 [Gammaproteobacteria bacterium TMED226]|nr:MAG: hypothetical protein CBD86_03560 [Gammaproteobacteria bacterium TMED226]|tara:strand:+ start:347 stop:541 length:195 start_codon:yes stop_codon:yes gene_type:complete